MGKVNDGDAAFPRSGNWSNDQEGMTLRDWFAGMAMQGMITDPTTSDNPDKCAQWSYAQADAMIAERSKQ